MRCLADHSKMHLDKQGRCLACIPTVPPESPRKSPDSVRVARDPEGVAP